MSARMSSDRRIGRLPSHPLRYETSLSEPAATFMDSLAYDEARSILAETERMPAPEDGGSAVYLPHAIYCDIARARDAACFVDERTILAESLRSFVGVR